MNEIIPSPVLHGYFVLAKTFNLYPLTSIDLLMRVKTLNILMFMVLLIGRGQRKWYKNCDSQHA